MPYADETSIPNPFEAEELGWVFASAEHDEALARMHFVIEGRQSCGILTGPPGSGKSRLFQKLLGDIRRTGRQGALLDLSGLNAARLLVRLDAVLGLNGGLPADSLSLWDAVMNGIGGLDMAGLELVLLLDHGQHAHPDVWPLLDQLLTQGTHGLTMLLASPQPPTGLFAEFVRRHGALRIELSRFSLPETARFIRAAFERVGADGTPFDSDAVRRIHELTHGEPRLVSRLCRIAMLAATADGTTEIHASLVDAAAEEVLLVAN